MADERALQTILNDLESGDPVEQYRPLRHEDRWRPKLVIPQCVTRIYRGLWGDQRIAQPILGPATLDDTKLGCVPGIYTPMRYRMDVMPKTRRRHWCDRWNVYPEKAAYFAAPIPTGRRPNEKLWCMLLMYEFVNEQHRPSFWINPLDPDWDFPARGEMEHGETYYVNHYPLPVSVAFVRLDLLRGTMKQRQIDTKHTLVSLANDTIPPDEWRPEPRVEKPIIRKSKLPRRYLAQ